MRNDSSIYIRIKRGYREIRNNNQGVKLFNVTYKILSNCIYDQTIGRKTMRSASGKINQENVEYVCQYDLN